MVQSLAPALLAELAKKKRNIESSKDESSKDGTSERSASPASKQRSSSKAASTKAASTKAVFASTKAASTKAVFASTKAASTKAVFASTKAASTKAVFASTKAASTKAVFASTKAASMKPAPSATKPAPSATKPAPATTKSSSLSSTTKWKKKVPSMNSGMLKLKGLPIGTPYQDIVEAIKPFGKCTNVIVLKKTNEAYVRIEKEQDSIALLNCKDLTVNGNKITVSLKETGEETHVEQKDQTDCKSAATKKESSPSAISKASHNKADPEKAPIKAAPVVKKVLRKEIPWRKNIVEIAGLPESGVSEEELASLARPHGFNTVPVIAMTLKKAYLELPDTHAAEAMVKAFSESPAKINDTILTVSKMSMPMDLSYTESLFRVLMGIEKTSEIVTLPERLVTIGNVPNSDSALTEILEIIKSIGAHKRFLLLNNRVIFEMESPDITQNVHAHFLKCPCTVQEKVLTATLARIPKAAKEAKRKKDVDANTSSQKPGKAEDKDSVDSGSVAHNLSKTDIATPEEAVAGGGGPTSVENVVSPASATLDIAMASPTREECATAELGSARALDVDMQEPDLPNEGVAEKSAASAEKGASQTEDETATSVPLPESSTETQQDLVDFAPVEDGFNGGKPEEMKTELEEDFTANRKADCGVTSCSELTETKNDFTEDPDQASTTNSEADVQPRNQQQTNKTASKPEGEQATGETDPDNPITKPDPSQDFLPVSQEMLKALEAAVHQCRMQSSLRQKQKQAEAQSNITATKDSKTNQSDLDKTTPEGDNEQPRLSSERSSSRSRRRGRAGSEDNRPASAPRDVSGSTPSVSQKSRKESSPVTSKSRERKDEGKRKSRSSSRISASSKSDSRAREEELVESEDFPFNLDEFVTVDEVGDEVEEVPVPKSFKDPQKPAEKKSAQKRSAPVARGKRAKKSPPQTRTYRTRSGMTKEVEAVKDEAANTAENQMEADVCEPADVPSHSEQEADELKTEVSTCTSVPLDEQEKAMDETMATDTETKAELQSALPTPSATLAPSTVTSEPSPADRAQDEIVAPGPVKEDCVSEERTPSAKVEEMQSAGSESLEESEKLPEPQTTTGITEPTSGRGEEEALGSHLQTQNVLVTLDEVCEEEDNYPEEVDEEELLKMQAGEYPEALFTVDEIGEDEVEEKDIHALVTLDEIVEEEDEEQKNLEITSETLPDNKEEEDERVDSFNPEALVTLDEANDDEMEQEGGTKNSKPVDNTTKAFDQSAEAPPSPDLDEFPQINFVTVDEVGEEDTQEEVRKAPPEELKEEEEEEEEVAVSTRKRTKGRRKARQTAAKRRAAAKAKEISEQESDKSPAMTSTTTELAPAAAESPIAHATLPTEEPEKEEPQLRQKEEEKDVDDQMQGDSEGTSETRAATKEAAKERREAETSEETKAKRSRSRSPVRMDFTMPPFSPNNPIGIDFVVPKMGYFCKLCSLFYSSEETAKKSHCSSMRHYQNVQKYYEKMRSEQGGS
uniref:Matrin-type domain-containing protein n=1 Tax=Denticeps clupeoides TaxID=299321 RepID=A0AAY3ZYG3_9TELE